MRNEIKKQATDKKIKRVIMDTSTQIASASDFDATAKTLELGDVREGCWREDKMTDINREELTECSDCKKYQLTNGTYGMYYPRFPKIGKERRYVSSGLCVPCFEKQMEKIIEGDI